MKLTGYCRNIICSTRLSGWNAVNTAARKNCAPYCRNRSLWPNSACTVPPARRMVNPKQEIRHSRNVMAETKTRRRKTIRRAPHTSQKIRRVPRQSFWHTASAETVPKDCRQNLPFLPCRVLMTASIPCSAADRGPAARLNKPVSIT